MGSERVDLPALRAVIAGVRERLAKGPRFPLVVAPDNDEYPDKGPWWVCVADPVPPHTEPLIGECDDLGHAELFASAPTDLTTLADACERLAEENERAREVVALLVRRAKAKDALLAAYRVGGRTPEKALDEIEATRTAVALAVELLTPAPAGEGEG